MSYLNRLKQLEADETFHHTPRNEQTKPTKGGSDGFVGSTPGAIEKNHSEETGNQDGVIFQKVTRPLPTKPSKGIQDDAAHWHWIVQLPDRVIETYHHPAATRAEVMRQYPDALDLQPMPEASSTATPEQDAELAALVRAVCREFGLDGAELSEALTAAMCDPAGAWLSYREMAHELSIRTINASPENRYQSGGKL